MRTSASTITSNRPAPVRAPVLAALATGTMLLGACSGLYVSPLAPPPYHADVAARRGGTWAAGPSVRAPCPGLYVSPLAPPPYHADVAARYDATWTALVRALAKENVPLRAIARDSGVIASDDFIAPVGVYADCGRVGDDRVEGEAL